MTLKQMKKLEQIKKYNKFKKHANHKYIMKKLMGDRIDNVVEIKNMMMMQRLSQFHNI